MQTANILLSLGGDSGNQVPKYAVTAAEIAVLRAIHGDESVTEVFPLADIARSNREELNRLRALYGNAHDNDGNRIVDVLYPGVAARVFEALDELDLPRELFAAKERVAAKPFGGKGDHDGDGKPGGAAPAQADGLAALKVPELRKVAEERGIDLGDMKKKADIIAAIEAASADAEGTDEDTGADADAEGEDGVGDMTDDAVSNAVFE